jgi:malonyl CoA-acyl carrier protein transacylase
METARVEWLDALRRITFSAPTKTLIANRSGLPVTLHDDCAALLAEQLTRPVEWVRTMRTIEELGLRDFVLVGAVRTLRGLCRANLGPLGRFHFAERNAPPAAEVEQ